MLGPQGVKYRLTNSSKCDCGFYGCDLIAFEANFREIVPTNARQIQPGPTHGAKWTI